MADRYWKIGHSMGYAGTDSIETIDVCKFMGWTKKELTGMTNDDVEEKLAKMEWEEALQKIDSWAEPITEDEME